MRAVFVGGIVHRFGNRFIPQELRPVDSLDLIAANRWLPLSAVARLLSLDHALVFKRAKAGKYGPIRKDANGQIYVTVQGVEDVARHCWSERQVRAAIAGQPLPPGDYTPSYAFNLPPRNHKPSVEENAVRLNHYAPRFTPPRMLTPDERAAAALLDDLLDICLDHHPEDLEN